MAFTVALAWAACSAPGKTEKGKDEARDPIVMPCEIDARDPGPMRKGGLAKVKIQGKGLALDTRDVPAICGPMFNVDAPKLGIVAGTGLFFETCVPHGSIQLSSFERVPGEQVLHTAQEGGGAEVSFNRVADSTYSSRGVQGDSIWFSPDFMRAKAKVKLHDVRSEQTFDAEIELDCTK